MWKEGNTKELIDDCLENSYILFEALRCIQVGILCPYRHPNNRPNMASVLTMLTNEIVATQPKEPDFLIGGVSNEGQPNVKNSISFSINEVTISSLDVR